MTTAKQIKGLFAPLLNAFADVVVAGPNRAWMKPIGPVGRMILVDRTSDAKHCVVSWHLVPFFMPDTSSWLELGRCSDQIARSKHFPGGQAWFWSDPTIYEDFVHQVDAVALTRFRMLDTPRKCLDFSRKSSLCQGYLDWEWHLATCLALDEIAMAQELWPTMRKVYLSDDYGKTAFEQRMQDRFRLLDEPLRTGNRDVLFALLRCWEAETIVGSPLEPHWLPSRFPLDD